MRKHPQARLADLIELNHDPSLLHLWTHHFLETMSCRAVIIRHYRSFTFQWNCIMATILSLEFVRTCLYKLMDPKHYKWYQNTFSKTLNLTKMYMIFSVLFFVSPCCLNESMPSSPHGLHLFVQILMTNVIPASCENTRSFVEHRHFMLRAIRLRTNWWSPWQLDCLLSLKRKGEIPNTTAANLQQQSSLISIILQKISQHEINITAFL